MIKYHDAREQSAASIGAALGLTLPTTPDPAEAAILASYQNSTGAAFDQAYASDQVTAHENTIGLFDSETTSGSNTQIIGFANENLPAFKSASATGSTTRLLRATMFPQAR